MPSAKITVIEAGTGEKIHRRNHSASFKAKEALAEPRGDKTVPEQNEQYDVHPNQTRTDDGSCCNRQVRHSSVVAIPHGIPDTSLRSCMQRSLEQGLERIHGPRAKQSLVGHVTFR